MKTEIHLSKNQVIGRGAEFFNKGQIKKKAMKTAVDFLKFVPPDTIEYHLMDENLELISKKMETKLFESGDYTLHRVPVEKWTADMIRVSKVMSRSGIGKYTHLSGLRSKIHSKLNEKID